MASSADIGVNVGTLPKVKLAAHRTISNHYFAGNASTIEYRFLRDQKLVVNTTLDKNERVGQLQRLRILVQSMD